MKNKILLRVSNLFTTSDGSIESRENHEVYWFQYIASFVVALPMFGCGMQLSWFGPTLPILNNEELSPIHRAITSTESAWVNSLLQVGAIPGALLGSILANKIGRKNTLIFTIIPNLISYFLFIFVQNVYMLFVARFLAGITNGITFLVVPIYLTEIASPKIRGIVGTFTTIFISLSAVTQFGLIPLTTFKSNSIMGLIISIIQCFATFFVPETPLYYIMKNKDNLAKQSLRMLQRKNDVEVELMILKKGDEENKTNFWENIQTKVVQKGLLLLGIPMLTAQFSGGLTCIGYAPTILKDSVPIISSHIGSLLLMFGFLIGTFLSIFFIDNWGRRPLFVIAITATGVFGILTGLYYQLEFVYSTETISKYSILLFVLLSLYLLVFSFGIFSLPYIFVGELFETNFRATASLILSAVSAAFGFAAIQIFEIIHSNYGYQYVFWLFGICCFVYGLLGFFLLPETKGKSLEQIHKDLM